MRHDTLKGLIAILAIAPALALGQEVELGQVLDKGAVRLSKAELESLVPGSTTKFTQWTTGQLGQSNVDYSWETPVGGKIPRAYGRGMKYSWDGTGTWRISDDGRYCWDLMMPRREWKACRFVFKVGDGYYMSPSGDDRAAKAIPVKFEKK
jgi:hypothetical protein